MTTQTQMVLAALLADPAGTHYGLEISRAANLPSGTLYPILARLEQAGWVESEWEQIDPSAAGRRARRYYRLTGVGERVARRELKTTVERLREAIGTAAEAPA